MAIHEGLSAAQDFLGGAEVQEDTLLDDLRDGRRDLGVELLSLANRADELRIHFLRQPRAHLAGAEGIDAEVLRRRMLTVAITVAIYRVGIFCGAGSDVLDGSFARVQSGRGHDATPGVGRGIAKTSSARAGLLSRGHCGTYDHSGLCT